MKFTTDDGRSIEWKRGMLTGDDLLVSAVTEAVRERIACAFDYWGEREASLKYEFDAYLTIGAVLFNETGVNPAVDQVPENPDGYEPEGAYEEDSIVAAASEFFRLR